MYRLLYMYLSKGFYFFGEVLHLESMVLSVQRVQGRQNWSANTL